jgi:hypothetical protein
MANEELIIDLLKQILEQLKTANQTLDSIDSNTTGIS